MIDSNVTFGASGAPVLDSRGLVEGVISRRTMIDRVLAVGAAETKAFLAGQHVRFEEDDRPQIAGGASPSPEMLQPLNLRFSLNLKKDPKARSNRRG